MWSLDKFWVTYDFQWGIKLWVRSTKRAIFFVFSDTVSTQASTEVPEVCSSVTTTYSASTHMQFGSFSL